MVRTLRLLFCVGLLLILVGCSQSPTPVTSPVTKVNNGEHGHKPSAHGGIVVAVDGDDYHAEAVFEKGGILRLYILGKNEAEVFEVETQALTGYAKLAGGTESESFALGPQPQPGDSPGMTSLFVGQLPREMAGKKIDVTVPALRVGKKRYRIAFSSAPAVEAHEMPAGVVGDDEKKLYLTPGGKYTQADIQANGGVVASVKFKGLKAEHDLHPKAGDRICPITLTKASPKFTWLVGGKAYAFCCPPCVDEFVATAKEKPNEIQPPEFYRKK